MAASSSSAVAEPAGADPALAMQKEWFDSEVRGKLRAEFAGAAPFRHVMVRPFLGEDGLRRVRADLEKLNATEKETDLFRFFQTSDLAPRPEPPANGKKKRRKVKHAAQAATSAPNLAALADIFASDSYRELCQDVTQCGDLTDRVDLSAQVYARGGHLLCHDDVIGTRKLSFIYYLTDPDEEWASSEGGALELYPPSKDGPRGTPATAPSKEVLPLSDALLIFVVEPGVSFHAVRETRGERARVSIQGWLHAPSLEQTSGFQDRNLATLQQLLQTRGTTPAAIGPSGSASASSAGPASPPGAAPAPLAAVDDGEEFTKEDKAFLGKWLSAEYLDDKHLEKVSAQFVESSYAMLGTFLRADVFSSASAALAAVDEADGFDPESAEVAVPDYTVGARDGWKAVGPPHLRRYLRFDGDAGLASAGERAPHSRLGVLLGDLSEQLFRTAAFRRWLRKCTSLAARSAGRQEVRRFRPGMDYTVAAQADHICPGFADLDVTLSFVTPGTEDKWSEEDCGGFESYLAADDENSESVEAQEVYRGAEDEGPLVNVPAAPNTLAVVMRDASTLRFVKYLSRDAPSSRVDISACYPVDAPDGSSSDAGDEDGAAGTS